MELPFTITIPRTEEDLEKPSKHQDILYQLEDGTILLYTDGSKLEDQNCSSARVVFPRGQEFCPELAASRCRIGAKAKFYGAELHTI